MKSKNKNIQSYNSDISIDEYFNSLSYNEKVKLINNVIIKYKSKSNKNKTNNFYNFLLDNSVSIRIVFFINNKELVYVDTEGYIIDYQILYNSIHITFYDELNDNIHIIKDDLIKRIQIDYNSINTEILLKGNDYK